MRQVVVFDKRNEDIFESGVYFFDRKILDVFSRD